MPKIGLDSQPCGQSPSNDVRADVSCPSAHDGGPLVVLGEPTSDYRAMSVPVNIRDGDVSVSACVQSIDSAPLRPAKALISDIGKKLCADDIRAIRHRYALGGETRAQLAECFEVAPCTISRIVLRKAWKHIA